MAHVANKGNERAIITLIACLASMQYVPFRELECPVANEYFQMTEDRIQTFGRLVWLVMVYDAKARNASTNTSPAHAQTCPTQSRL